jgi:hypothetical protein
MSQWGSRDFTSGNNKPVWANTPNVYGANTAEASLAGRGVHPGWVSVVRHTGPVASIEINHPGGGYNANGFIVFTGGGGSGANASFIAKSNTANVSDNTVISVTLISGGANYNTAPVATANLGNSNAATFVVRMGGKAGRFSIETLVAMDSITGSSNAFPNLA